MTLSPPPSPPDDDSADQHARRFGQARAAQSAILLEDYVELIAELEPAAAHGPVDGPAGAPATERPGVRITDIARRLGISHASVIKSLARLRREGLAESRPYRGVVLTEAGRTLARRVHARHLLVVELLCAVGVPQAVAAIDAEGIEHHVSDATLDAFRRFLDARAAPGRS